MGKKVDILSIGAHAGDPEIATGITLAHHVNAGKKVALCYLTLGEKGNRKMDSDAYAAQRRYEVKATAEVLGAEHYILKWKDGELPVSDEVKFAIADVIRDCKPDVIITHHPKSIHKDHVNCSLNVPDAIFYASIAGFKSDKDPHFCRSLYFAENWEDKEDYVPDLYLEVTERDIAMWRELVSKHALFRGEVVAFPYVEYYEKLVRIRGIEKYMPYAVTLELPSWAKTRQVTTLL